MGINHIQNQGGEYNVAWRYWSTRLIPTVELTPFRIALVYLVLGFLALFASDVLLVRYVSEPLVSQLQALKGGVEVLLTAVLIFALVGRREAQLQHTMSRLSQHREELEVLHRVLRHNLRNDLNVIQGHTQQICNRTSADPLDWSCETIFDTIEGMAHYTEQANRIKQITTRDGEVQTYNVTEILTPVIEKSSREYSGVDVSATVPDDALVEANTMLGSALEELVTNAVKHNDSETPQVTIEVDEETDLSHMVEIRVADNGPGIPDSELKPLLEGTEDQLLHLSGMGLWFVEWTVRHSGGELVIENREPRGTIAIVRVPKAPEGLSSALSPLNAD